MQVEAKYIDSREEWLRWRMQDVTGSDLGALAGCDKHKSARALYEEKCKHWLEVDDTDNAVLQRGRWQEAAVIEAVLEHHPYWIVSRSKEYLRASEHRLGGTPDASGWFTEVKGHTPVDDYLVIECKSVVKPVFDEDWLDGPPLKYKLQALANAMLCNAKCALIAVLVRDTWTDTYHEFWIERHADAEAGILRMVMDFWDRVEAQTPPDFDFSADADLIRAVYGKPSLPSVDLSDNNRIDFLCEVYLDLKQQEKNIQGGLKAYAAEIQSLIGDAEVAEHPSFNISWKLQKRKEYTVPAGESRVLRVTQKHKKAKAA